MTLDPPLVWFLVGLGLALLEFVVPGVILIFFAAGAWVVAGVLVLEPALTVPLQLLTFTVASVGLLVGLRNWVQGALYGHITHSQDPDDALDEFRGKQVKLLKDIVPGRVDGAIEFKGALWTVISDVHLRKGDTALIIGVEGVALKITKGEEV